MLTHFKMIFVMFLTFFLVCVFFGDACVRGGERDAESLLGFSDLATCAELVLANFTILLGHV